MDKLGRTEIWWRLLQSYPAHVSRGIINRQFELTLTPQKCCAARNEQDERETRSLVLSGFMRDHASNAHYICVLISTAMDGSLDSVHWTMHQFVDYQLFCVVTTVTRIRSPIPGIVGTRASCLNALP